MWAFLKVRSISSASSSSGGLRGSVWRGRGGFSWGREARGASSGVVPSCSPNDPSCLLLVIGGDCSKRSASTSRRLWPEGGSGRTQGSAVEGGNRGGRGGEIC